MPLKAGSTALIKGKKVKVWRTAEDDSPEASRAAIFGAAEETTRLSKANLAEIMSKRQSFRKKKTAKND